MKSNDICNAHEWDDREEVHLGLGTWDLGRISWHVNKVGVITLARRNFMILGSFLANMTYYSSSSDQISKRNEITVII